MYDVVFLRIDRSQNIIEALGVLHRVCATCATQAVEFALGEFQEEKVEWIDKIDQAKVTHFTGTQFTFDVCYASPIKATETNNHG